jgi:hypothetical protein
MPMDPIHPKDAISKPTLHSRLRSWLDTTPDNENIIGDPGMSDNMPWVFIQDEKRLFYLESGTTRREVEWYLDLVKRCGGTVEWTPIRNPRSRGEHVFSVKCGPDQEDFSRLRFLVTLL